MAPLIRAPQGLQPSGSARCPAHTTGLSDSPRSFIDGLRPPAFPSRSGPSSLPENRGISQFLRKECPCMQRVYDRARPLGHLRLRARGYCLPPHPTASAPWKSGVRGSMARLHFPLSTLQPHPRGHRRMTRGRSGSLLLPRMALSSTTPCQSPGAFWVSGLFVLLHIHRPSPRSAESRLRRQ